LLEGGFGLKNAQEAIVTIRLSHQAMSIEANGKTFAYPCGPDECRISKNDTLTIAQTNISRGYQTYRVSALRVQAQRADPRAAAVGFQRRVRI
jgi:hypothetical protein